jgi:hypothetical protein
MNSRVTNISVINARGHVNVPITDGSKIPYQVKKLLTFAICFSSKLKNHGHFREFI